MMTNTAEEIEFFQKLKTAAEKVRKKNSTWITWQEFQEILEKLDGIPDLRQIQHNNQVREMLIQRITQIAQALGKINLENDLLDLKKAIGLELQKPLIYSSENLGGWVPGKRDVRHSGIYSGVYFINFECLVHVTFADGMEVERFVFTTMGNNDENSEFRFEKQLERLEPIRLTYIVKNDKGGLVERPFGLI